MERRDVLSTLLAGVSGAATSDFWNKKEKSKGRFLLVVNLNVGRIPSVKVGEFVEKIKTRLIEDKKPDNFIFLVIPQRDYSTHVEVFSIDGEIWVGGPHDIQDNNVRENINDVWIDQKLAEGTIHRITSEFSIGSCIPERTDEEILKYCREQFLAENMYKSHQMVFDLYVKKTILLGRKHMVFDLQSFVRDSLNDERLDMEFAYEDVQDERWKCGD